MQSVCRILSNSTFLHLKETPTKSVVFNARRRCDPSARHLLWPLEAQFHPQSNTRQNAGKSVGHSEGASSGVNAVFHFSAPSTVAFFTDAIAVCVEKFAAAVLATTCMNDQFSRCTTAMNLTPTQNFSRCERVQQDFVTSTVGSLPPSTPQKEAPFIYLSECRHSPEGQSRLAPAANDRSPPSLPITLILNLQISSQ